MEASPNRANIPKRCPSQWVNGNENIADQTTEISLPWVVWEMLGQLNQDRTMNKLRQSTGEEPICLKTALAPSDRWIIYLSVSPSLDGRNLGRYF